MKKNQLLGLVGALLLTATLGFIAGRSGHPDNQEANDGSKIQNTTHDSRGMRRSGNGSTPESRGKNSRGPREVKKTMRHLLAELERSPLANMDFDAIFGVWEIARNFSEDEVREALTFTKDIKNMQLRMTIQMMLMNRWGKINGSAAMEHAMSADNNQSRMMQVMGTLMSWTKDDPEAAFSWFEKNKEGTGTGIYATVYQGMIYQAMARHDLNRALGQADQIENPQAKQTALSSIAGGIADQPEKLKSFLQHLDEKNDPETKNMVMNSIISSLAMTDPDSAKQYIKEVADDQVRGELVQSLVRSMAYADPEEAMKWGIEQASNASEREQMMNSTLQSWVSQDPKGAGAWYDKQPQHLKSDTMITQSASQLAGSGQYKDAFSWLERGKNSETINKSKRETYQMWANKSPIKAKEWLEGEGKEIMQGIDLNIEGGIETIGPKSEGP